MPARSSSSRRRKPASGRPAITRLLDALGRRWSLRILWELHRADSTLTFRALQGACGGVSPTVLNERIRDLRALGIVAAGADGYALSRAGRTLAQSLSHLHDWAERHM
jgi:DNA-binding HxlR family transcriptional regulator